MKDKFTEFEGQLINTSHIVGIEYKPMIKTPTTSYHGWWWNTKEMTEDKIYRYPQIHIVLSTGQKLDEEYIEDDYALQIYNKLKKDIGYE